jgi:hypothetical protein
MYFQENITQILGLAKLNFPAQFLKIKLGYGNGLTKISTNFKTTSPPLQRSVKNDNKSQSHGHNDPKPH